MNDEQQPRVIRFDGAKNVRDLGGLATSHGRITRFWRRLPRRWIVAFNQP